MVGYTAVIDRVPNQGDGTRVSLDALMCAWKMPGRKY